jgi:DNA (cytosine-5)-methyltransferase 1
MNNHVFNNLTAISLFAGAGGMELGASNAGIKVIYANELVPLFCSTLRKNFPNTEVTEGTIANIKSFPQADLVFGGYPCQSFSMGGNRDPEKDHRTSLYKEFGRVLELVQPKFFIAENVSGLMSLKSGSFLEEQLKLFGNAGKHGYTITYQVLNAKDYGVPQSRKRILLVGVRNDLGLKFVFPDPTHGKPDKKYPNLLPYTSHGEVIKDLPLWPEGEFYKRPDWDGTFSWYFMSRNRKAAWDEPAFTVVANWRHITLHPASPVMKMVWSDLANGFKQKWEFSDEYEHIKNNTERPILDKPRRLSWRECARIQTFPDTFQFEGKVEEKFTQIGNAVPPMLFEAIVKHLVTGKGLVDKISITEDQKILSVKQPLPLF